MQNIQKYLTNVDMLRDSYSTPRDAPSFAVIGPYNTGKSTLINNLLGLEISPVDVIPATSSVIVFRHGPRFLARVDFGNHGNKEITVLTRQELVNILTDKIFKQQKIAAVEVQLDHELLKKIKLIDTPGIDAATGPAEVPENLGEIDHIIYLLHQRGPGEADRLTIQSLLEQKKAGEISFWINCNLGHCDGSSLMEARRVLREICGSEIQVHLVDTKKKADIEKLRLYLEERAGSLLIKRLQNNFKEQDRKIPGLTAAALNENSDSLFLSKFWEARDYSRQVIEGQNAINSIPPITQEIQKLLGAQKITPFIIGHTSAEYTVLNDTLDPAEVKKDLITLIDKITADPVLKPYAAAIKDLGVIAGKLEKESYLVTAAGGFSSGKTTFLNALMGEALLPAENRPTTFAITKIRYGPQKQAKVKFAGQLAIPTHFQDGNQALICRHELAILEKWLTDPELCKNIRMIKKIQNGTATVISPAQVLQELEQLKQTFARVKREFKDGRRPWKTLFKKIPLRKFIGLNPIEAFIVNFSELESIELNLDYEADRTALARLAGSHLALRVELIEITHPASVFRLAEFIDTPGLDSVYHRHTEITEHYLPLSDCFLVFLNGKNVLTKPDLGIIEKVNSLIEKQNGLPKKMFILVNFADTLNPREQEKVLNYLAANLNSGLAGRIYFISALEVLKGRDRTRFRHLLSQLKEQIWNSRAEKTLKQNLQAIGRTLSSIAAVNTPTNRHDNGKPSIDYSERFNGIKEQFSQWRNIIDDFVTRDDLNGFRDGKKTVKKGFLGLSRKVKPVPSYNDLVAGIQRELKYFEPELQPPPGVNSDGLSSILERLIDNKTEVNRACRKIISFLNEEENRIYDALHSAINISKAAAAAAEPAEKVVLNPRILAAVNNYQGQLELLQKKFLTPGGSNDGKRQSVGRQVAQNHP